MAKQHKYLQNIYARFLSKVDTRGFQHDVCWIWLGASKGNGYGNVSFNGGKIPAHRLSYILFVGDIPEGLDHLFLGTREENMKDAVRKGRTAGGTRKHLKEGDIQEIRQRLNAGVPLHIIAAKFNITENRINSIKRGDTYAEVGNGSSK